MSHNCKVRVVWHVAAMGNWREVVSEQLALCERVGLDYLHCTFVGVGLDWLMAAAQGHGITLAVEASDPNIAHYETLAMLYMERASRTSERPFLYFHTKGVSNPADGGKRRWRLAMERVVVERWRDNLDHLTRFNAVGFNWRNCSGCPHFSGNFWLARAAYIRSLPDFAAYHGARGLVRYNCEFWIGSIPNPCIASLGTTEEDLGQPGYDFDALARRIELGDQRLRLNLGCNQWYHDGWVNVDFDRANRADLYEDAETLPSIQAGTVAEIYAGHLVEHLVQLGPALRRWYALLAPGGLCTIAVPDLVGAIALWRHGKCFPGVELPADQGLLAITTGIPTTAWLGNADLGLHRRVFDVESLRLCMEAAGFKRIAPIDDHPCMVRRCSDLGWQVALQGSKPH